MQNFKQFLLENESPLARLRFSIFTNDSTLDSNYTKDEIFFFLKKYCKTKNFNNTEIHIDEWEFEINLYQITENVYTNKQLLDTIKNDLVKYVEKVIGDSNSIDEDNSTFELSFAELPKSKVEWDEIAIRPLAANPISLANIHNLIFCKKLRLGMTKNIKSNVLGLLNMKSDINFLLREPWTQIVEKYLHDKDILECQEELIDAGLKDYAKL